MIKQSDSVGIECEKHSIGYKHSEVTIMDRLEVQKIIDSCKETETETDMEAFLRGIEEARAYLMSNVQMSGLLCFVNGIMGGNTGSYGERLLAPAIFLELNQKDLVLSGDSSDVGHSAE